MGRLARDGGAELLNTSGAESARRRAFTALASFGAGLYLAHGLVHLPAAAWFAGACACVAGVIFARGRACHACLILCALLLGGAWMTARTDEPPRTSVERLVPADAWLSHPFVRVQGVLEGDPKPTVSMRTELDLPLEDRPAWRVRVRLSRVETEQGWMPASGRVDAIITADTPAWRGGDWVQLAGRFTPSSPAMNPNERGRASYTRMMHLAGRLSVPDGSLVTPAAAPGVLSARRGVWYRVRSAVQRRAVRAMGLDPGVPGDALVGALVLGEQDPVLYDTRDSFQRVGVAHLMAISGFHLAILAGMALVIIRASGDRGWLEPAFVALLVLVYIYVLPTRTPVLRAAMMVILVLGTDATGRRYDRLTVLAWVGVALLVWRPMDLFNLGYQLSMSITAVLLAMGERQRRELRADPRRSLDPANPGPAWRAIPRWLGAYAWTCVACWLVAAPMIMAHTHTFSPAAPIATMLTLPLVLITLELGYLATAVGLVVGPVGPLSDLAGAAGSVTVAFVTWTDSVSWTWTRTGPVSALWAGAASLSAYWFVTRSRLRDPRAWAIALVLVGWAFVEMRTAARPGPAVALRVDTLAVNDGTCHLIRSGSETLLWDCGSLTPGVGEQTIEPALRSLGARRVRTAVITHANLDHFNALPHIAQAFGVERVITTHVFLAAAERDPRSPEGIAYARLRAQGVVFETLAAGDTFEFGDARVDVLWPPDPLPGRGVTGMNDTSLVARFRVDTPAGARTLVMTGDIQAGAVAALLGAWPEGERASVLELPHHGSVSFESASFVAALDPAVVMQSTGPKRARLPAWTGLRAQRAWWTTAEHGAAWAELRRDGTVTSGAMIERRGRN
ncbi:MAG: hypothetical protein DHS20C14_14650 [Phycisphaeraceae bacterium]|nr:MAG: hypothetical protein DHS20C14_14650 [Phycisphaeraceae bacterium]